MEYHKRKCGTKHGLLQEQDNFTGTKARFQSKLSCVFKLMIHDHNTTFIRVKAFSLPAYEMVEELSAVL